MPGSVLQFQGLLASKLKDPERRYVLQRAQGRLMHATADEVLLYFHLKPHPNLCVPVDVMEHRGLTLLASPFEPEGTVRSWVVKRRKEGHSCWSHAHKAPPKEHVNPFALVDLAPVWGVHTLRPKRYRPPVGKSVLAESLRRSTSVPPQLSGNPSRGTNTASAAVSEPEESKQRNDRHMGSSGHSRGSSAGDDIVVNHEEAVHRARIALHTARGLAYLHENHMLHLDLHAGNVLVTSWNIPRVQHARSPTRRATYYGAKVMSHSLAVVPRSSRNRRWCFLAGDGLSSCDTAPYIAHCAGGAVWPPRCCHAVAAQVRQ